MIAITPQTVFALAPYVDRRAWIAFVEARSSAGTFVKIEATKNLVSRVRAIDNDNPMEIALLGLIESPNPAEAARTIQVEYQSSLIKSGWFTASMPLLTFIEKSGQTALTTLVQHLRVNSTSPILTVEELAKSLSVSEQTIYRMVREGRIPHFRFGNQLRFVAADVFASVRRNT